MAAGVANNGGRGRMPWRLIGWGGAALLLLLPLVAGWPWSLSDFVFIGTLFGLVGAGIELAVRKRNAAFSLAAGLALGASLLSAWIPGAVGIIGSERDDANILYVGVVVIALLGSIGALFRPSGMAAAMAAAGIAELLIPFAAWLLWPELRDAIVRPEVPVITVFLAGIWLTSAWLFRKAGKDPWLDSPAARI